MRKFSIAGLAVLLAATLMSASVATAATVDAFGDALKAWAAKEKVPAAFVVVRHAGKIAYRFALGGLDTTAPVPLASLSKAITGACVATLVRDGKLAFDTPLSTALAKFFAANGRPEDPRALRITVGQLLTHRSGIAGAKSGKDPGTGSVFVGFLGNRKTSEPPPAAFYSLVFKADLVTDPGTTFDYSNGGFLVLGAVVEEATGKPYAAYCADAVLKPQGAAGALDPKWAILGSYGGWRLTAEDYLRFLDVFDPANPALGKTALAFLFSPDGKASTLDGSSWYALGRNVRRAAAGFVTWHFGEWRYAVSAKQNPLSTDFSTFAVRAPDGTEWFVYATPAMREAAKGALDAALATAYASVTAWP